MIRVLLVDDHEPMRRGIRLLLEQSGSDITVIAESGEGAEALALARQLRPDLVLLDLRLHGLGGVEVARVLRHDLPEIKVLVLTAYDQEQYVRALFAIGVQGYLLKTDPEAEIVAAVRAVQRGGQALSTELAQRERRRAGIAAQERLTAREQEVLLLAWEGASNKEIARRLSSPAHPLAVRTVDTHMSHIMAKLGAHSRTEAFNEALKRDLILPAP